MKLSNGCRQTSVCTPDRGTKLLVLAIVQLQNNAEKDGWHDKLFWMWWQSTLVTANGVRNRLGCGSKEHKVLLMAWGTCWHVVAQIVRSCSCLSTLMSAAISSTCLEDVIHSWIVPWISPHHLLYLVNYRWYLSSWPVMNLWTYSVCEVTRAGQAISFIHQSTAPSMHVTCSLASPSKFHQPKPNKWCTHFVISMVSETAGHEKRCRSQGHDLWYYLLSTAYLFYTIQLTDKIPISVLHCFNVVPKLVYPFSAIARNSHST